MPLVMPLRYCGRMDGYDDQWRELKSRRKLALFAFIGYVPITLAFALLTHNLFRNDKPVFAFAIAWMVFAVVAAARCNTFPCPRCGKWFFSTWWYHNGFAPDAFTANFPSIARRGKPPVSTESKMSDYATSQELADLRVRWSSPEFSCRRSPCSPEA